MAWFTDTASAPYIALGTEVDLIRFTITTDMTTIDKKKVRTVTRWEHVGLTRAAADSIAIAKASDSVDARSVRQNDAAAYKVVCARTIRGTWV